MDLNNYIQHTYGRQRVVKYDVTCDGPVHNCTWKAIAYSKPCASLVHHISANLGHTATVNGVEYGQKTDTTKKQLTKKQLVKLLVTLKQYGLPEEPAGELISEGDGAVEMEEATGSGEASGAGGDGRDERQSPPFMMAYLRATYKLYLVIVCCYMTSVLEDNCEMQTGTLTSTSCLS